MNKPQNNIDLSGKVTPKPKHDNVLESIERAKTQLSGIILVNKPRGISSNTVVNIVKHAVGANKAGHLGTLDVAGEGLLPVTVGKATKLFDYYLNKDKVYKTVFKFGETTDTLDLEGQVTATDNKVITKQALEKVLPEFIGSQAQMPPAYSAKKINGKKAYDLARKGESVNLKPKEIEIYEISLLNELAPNTFELLVHCSSGTYIRSLCRDIATSLSTFGVMQRIQRTRCGVFKLENAYSLEEIKHGKYQVISIDSVLTEPEIKLNEIQSRRLLDGLLDSHVLELNVENGIYKVYGLNQLLGLVKFTQGKLQGFILRLV